MLLLGRWTAFLVLLEWKPLLTSVLTVILRRPLRVLLNLSSLTIIYSQNQLLSH